MGKWPLQVQPAVVALGADMHTPCRRTSRMPGRSLPLTPCLKASRYWSRAASAIKLYVLSVDILYAAQ